MSKIELTDNFQDIIVKLSERNPGAITALMELMNVAQEIDPQSAFGSLGPAFSFDSHGIYGTEIYRIWSDKCEKNARKTILLLRAVQLGIFSVSKLKTMAADQMRKVNLTDEEWRYIDAEVCERLENFQRAV